MAKGNRLLHKSGDWHVVNVDTGRRISISMDKQVAISLASLLGWEYKACQDGYRLVPCDGPAHANAHIDNCGVCAPRRGWVMVKDEPDQG